MATRTQVESVSFASTFDSANWAQMNTGPAGDILHNGSGGVRGQFGEQSGTQHAMARRTTTAANAASADQYAEITAAVYVNIGSTSGVGVLLCATGTGSGKSGYELYAAASGTTTAAVRLVKWVSGTPTTVKGPVDVALAANDVLTLEKVGGQLRVYVDGVEQSSLAHLDGSPLTSGTWGLSATVGMSITAFAAGTASETPASELTGNVTLDGTATGGGFSSVASSLTGNVTLDDTAPAGTLGAAPGTFTSAPLKNNTGTVLASIALTYFRLYSVSTGALVLTKTGLSTNASGVVSFTDAALVAGTAYKADWLTAEGHYRMPSATAT